MAKICQKSCLSITRNSRLYGLVSVQIVKTRVKVPKKNKLDNFLKVKPLVV